MFRYGYYCQIGCHLSLNSINVTAVDLVPETFESFKYFHPNDQEVLKRTNVTLITNDGRNHLLLSSKKYDVITVDPAPPIWSAGTVNLYSKEFFQLCKDRLNLDGSMCLWFPGGKPEDKLAILRTFSEVFPYTSVWSGPNRWGNYFIGTIREVPWTTFEHKAEQAFQNPAILKDLSEYDNSCTSAKQLYSLLLLDNDEVKKLRSQGVIITDDYPFTEFFLWRRLLGKRPVLGSPF
jgi:spermidine synthase